MSRWIKTSCLVCITVSMVAGTAVAISILSQIAIDHTTRYVASYENITKAEQFIEAEKYSTRLLSVTEEAIRAKNEKEKELAALKRVTEDLYTRLNNKENSIAEYCQATQDLSRANDILIRKLRNLGFLFQVTIQDLPEDKQKEARKRFLDVSSNGGEI